ncbi:Transcriptional regulator, AbiEi antitoxin, Type IV TA system [Gemmobacter aquatilis]|uniref:Transcriptional regulator, AbiEi antitoxin, Type IV TA system n=1 Tax=Gemmobacter aquatilis TaxID=933059 RepID=A0A1H8LL26_9RHOB|nr:type IV toxin-antitoxin system AbiEi family antitoxin [Gemmobacter aquatilis]SEO05854.1 Transcriptional regulator, AbiEi antitoxin, Type IV TA system [Gemmobacter aquatilis]
MDAVRSQNLKKLIDAVPAGYLVDAAWLVSHGIAYESFRDYVKRGWLERITRGVFRRPIPTTPTTNSINWKTCILSMQHIMGHDLHVGGTTALGEQGHAHYLRLGKSAPVWVYGDSIPKWLVKLPTDVPINIRPRSLFADPKLSVTLGNRTDLPWDWGLTMSTPERAILEAMDELPDNESFHTLDMVFESLTNLRPRLLSDLLQACRKIKVKRLFFVFADRHNHPWRKRIDPQAFDLGSGDRALIKGGKIHPHYRIVVPEEFVKPEAESGA